jgi:RNA polymerase sigma-70 factor (ECF subfamily)
MAYLEAELVDSSCDDDLSSGRAAWRSDLEGEIPWMQELAGHLARDREEARELVQDTWLMALRRPPRDRGRPRAWIGAVMRNLARQGGRRLQRRGRKAADGSELSDPRPQPLQTMERRELEALLRREIEELPLTLRQTLREHFERGWTSAEIARRQGIPAGTVRWRVKTAIDQLRARLDERHGQARWMRALAPLLAGSRWLPPTVRAGTKSKQELIGLETRGASLSKPVLAAALVLLTGGVVLRLLGSSGSAVAEGPTRGANPIGGVASVAALEPLAVESNSLLSAGEATSLPPGASSTSDEALARVAATETLAVLVQDEHGARVPNAEVWVAAAGGFEARARSDAGGMAQVSVRRSDIGALEIAAGRDRIALRASAEGFGTSDAWFVPWAGADESVLELTLHNESRRLRGRVLRLADEPVAGVELFALHNPQHASQANPAEVFHEPLALGTRSDESGDFELRGLPAESLVLCIRAAGEEPLLKTIDDRQDEVIVRLGKRGVVQGRITDERGQPANGARVWVEPMYRGSEWCAGIPGYDPEHAGFTVATRTDSEGRYELAGVHARDRRIYARSATDTLAAASAVLTVTLQGVSRWDVALTRESSLRLHLVDGEGTALAGRMAQLISTRDSGPRWVRWIESDTDGRIVVPEARTDADLIVYDASGLRPPVLEQEVSPSSDEQEIVVDERQLGIQVGRLATIDGIVPAQARLEAYRNGVRVPATIHFDPENGRFRSRIQPGSYALTLRTEWGGARIREVEVCPAERARLGRLDPPLLGTLTLRADALQNGESYRLSFCFGETSVKFREGALPLLSEESCYAGLYRLDAAAGDGTLQSGWVRVAPGEFTELDLERLPRVLVEVTLPSQQSGSVQLIVEESVEESMNAPPSEKEARRCLPLAWRSDGRFRHTLRLAPGTWRLRAEVGDGREAEQETVVEPGSSQRVRFDLR